MTAASQRGDVLLCSVGMYLFVCHLCRDEIRPKASSASAATCFDENRSRKMAEVLVKVNGLCCVCALFRGSSSMHRCGLCVALAYWGIFEDEQLAHGNLADFRDEQTANASLIALTTRHSLYPLLLTGASNDDIKIHVL